MKKRDINESFRKFIKNPEFTAAFNEPEDLEESLESKFNIGSNKLINPNSETYKKLEELAEKLEENSFKGWKYYVDKTYEDFGSGMQWHNIICDDKKGRTWQVLNTKQWLDLANSGDVDAIYEDVISSEYFKDNEANMTMSDILNMD